MHTCRYRTVWHYPNTAICEPCQIKAILLKIDSYLHDLPVACDLKLPNYFLEGLTSGFKDHIGCATHSSSTNFSVFTFEDGKKGHLNNAVKYQPEFCLFSLPCNPCALFSNPSILPFYSFPLRTC
jgi:hypothetical protein